MLAVLIATGFRPDLDPIIQHRPTPMLSVVDKPVLVHIIEILVKLGVKQLHLILHHIPEKIEARVGDGQPWGIQIHCHLVKDVDFTFAFIKRIVADSKESIILLGEGDSLPNFSSDCLMDKEPRIWVRSSGEGYGWGIFETSFLTSIDGRIHYRNLSSLFPSIKKIEAEYIFEMNHLNGILTSNLRFIESSHTASSFPATARMIEPGIWISRGVVIHPKAKIIPPVFIGNDCKILSNVRVGPKVVLERHCIIDENSSIQNSLVCRNSYIGENLEVDHCIIDRNLLINLSHGTIVIVNEDFILSELNIMGPGSKPVSLLGKFAALFLIIFLSPLFLYMFITCELKITPMVKLPASKKFRGWETFDWIIFTSKEGKHLNSLQKLCRGIPLLFKILKGEIHFIGAAPLSPKDLDNLPSDWKRLYVKSKVGIITLADLNSDNPSLEDRYAAEAFYAVHMSRWYDFKLMLRYIRKKISELLYLKAN